MLETLDTLAQYSPFLAQAAKVVLVIVAILVCWLVLSIPFALLHWGADPWLRASINFVERLLQEMLTFVGGLKILVGRPMANFVDLARLTIIHVEQNRNWLSFARRVDESISTLEMRTVKAVEGLNQQAVRLQATADNIEYPDLEHPDIQIPDVNEYQAAQKAGRAGWTRFVVGLILVVLLFTLNSWMLKLFFDGIVSGYLVFSLGLKVSHGIAMLFSLMEASLGVVLYWYSGKNNQEDVRGFLVETIVYVSIGLLALIELYLYFKLSLEITGATVSNWGSLTLLETIDSIWISPFGPVIVIVLSMSGHILMDGFDQLRSAGDTADILSKFRSLDTLVKGFRVSVDQVNEGMAKAKEAATDLSEEFAQIGSRKPLLSEEVSTGVLNWEQAVSSCREIFENPYQELDEREGKVLYYQSLSFLAMAAVIFVTFVWSQQTFLKQSDFLPGLGWVYPIIACVEAVLILLAGHIDAERRIVGIGMPEIHLLPSAGTKMARYASYLAVAAVALFVTILTLTITQDPSWVAWALQLACIAGLYVLGRSLRLLLLALWSLTQSCAIGAVIGLSWMVHGLLIVAHLLLQISRFLIAICSIPSVLLVRLFYPRGIDGIVPEIRVPRGKAQ